MSALLSLSGLSVAGFCRALTSEDEEERRFTVNVIKQIRKDAESADLGDSLPCQFETPSVNFDATNLQT